MSKKVIKTSLWFTILSLVASALNFLYYPITARSLSLAAFGDVQVGISFVMQAAALFTSLNTLALFFAAQKSTEGNIMPRLERLVIGLSTALALLTFVFAQPISHTLQLHDPSLLYILAVIFILNIPASTWLGSIQGQGQFIESGLIAVVSSALKIIAGVVAISLGFGAHGALFGILVGSFIVLPLAYVLQKRKDLHIRQTFRMPNTSDLRMVCERPLIFVLFLSLFLLALSSTVDVIAAKALLSPEDAGRYAQLSTAAKIPYFAAVPVALIAFERLMKKMSRQRNVLAIFSGLITAIAIITVSLEAVIMQFFFGAQPGTYNSLTFALLCLAFSAYALSTLLIYNLISRRQVGRVLAVATLILCAPLVCLANNGLSIDSIAYAYTIGQLLPLLVAVGLQYTGRHG